ncbi:putative hydrolases of HD superfamily [Lachnospiraceae bacterium NE2001]|nr:putative hydrolases of HD superfamily [Lachnospiraceae bacterium NE2001]
MNTRDFLNILHVAERLKDTTRHCTTSKRRVESVAEHSWRVSLMATLLRSEFPDVDIDKVVNMCLIHDLGECFTGDIPAFDKTDQDRNIEDTLLSEWVDSLPREVSEYMKALYAEMDSQETRESKLYKALDKLEALIQHNESPLDTWSENECELNQTYAFENVEFSEWLMELRKEILQDTIDKIDSEKPDIQILLSNLDRLHTTEMGAERIKKNLKLDCDNVVLWCRQKIIDKDAVITRQGKNWYIKIAGCKITVNAKSYTIITAHEI